MYQTRCWLMFESAINVDGKRYRRPVACRKCGSAEISCSDNQYLLTRKPINSVTGKDTDLRTYTLQCDTCGHIFHKVFMHMDVMDQDELTEVLAEKGKVDRSSILRSGQKFEVYSSVYACYSRPFREQ